MIRALNFCCFALTVFACLALYHVSEEARVAHAELRAAQHRIADEREALRVLQADWQRSADPARIQQLALTKLGMGDMPTMALASLELLPRRGASRDLQQVNAVSPAQPSDPHLHEAALHASE